jgi:hypothetical protein
MMGNNSIGSVVSDKKIFEKFSQLENIFLALATIGNHVELPN